MNLLQSQKNRIYDIIQKEGLSPSMFYFQDNTKSVVLYMKSSNYYFNIAENGTLVKYSPGPDSFEAGYFSTRNWEDQVEYIIVWLQCLVRELNEPDKWKLLQEGLEGVDFSDIKYEDIKFSYQEYELLKIKMDELKEKLGRLDLLESQLKQINDKLDHLLNLAKSMNKTDWKELFIGSVISLIMQLSIDKATGQAIFALIRGLFIKFLPLN